MVCSLVWGAEMAGTPNKFFRVGLWYRLIGDFKLLFSLIKDYWKGDYRDVSLWSILIFFLAVFYILCPIDIITDVIPIAGQIDDAVVLLLCLYFLEKDLYKYREWKAVRSKQGRP
jgi:uncharacterized membrane protein YkvA (DUF1232 family)